MSKVKLDIKLNKIIQIRNILRELGFSNSQNGTKFLSKAILYAISLNNDVFILEKIYDYLSKYYEVSSNNIKQSIQYSILSRNQSKSKANFEKVFGYEYDDYIFVTKNLIEEITYIIK